MEERTSTDFPTAGTSPGVGTSGTTGLGASSPGVGSSGLSQLEATERSDTGREGGGMRQQMGAKAHRYASEGKHQAKRFGGLARDRLVKQADNRKSMAVSQLDEFASTLEEVSRTLEERGNDTQKEWVDRGARLVRKASRQVRTRSSEDLLDLAQQQLKSNPAVAIAGAFALGFLGIRMLRS